MKGTKLIIKNPSDYERSGFAEILLQSLDLDRGRSDDVTFVESTGRSLEHHYYQVLENDSRRDCLTFEVSQKLPPFGEMKIEAIPRSSTPSPACGSVILDPDKDGTPAVTIRNSRIKAYFYLQTPRGVTAPYAGAATSVVLDGREFLQPWTSDWWGHHPEKRCMQLDKIRLQNPAWDKEEWQVFDISKTKYRLVSHSEGPIKVGFTIATEPFEYCYSTPSGRQSCLICELYRTMTLLKDADYFMDEVFVLGRQPSQKGPNKEIYFNATYFNFFDMGFSPWVLRYDYVPDWLAIGSRWPPYAGYAFATDVHTAGLCNPHPGYPLADSAHRSFSWKVLRGSCAKCLHHFRFWDPNNYDHNAGLYWYEHVYEPLRVTRI